MWCPPPSCPVNRAPVSPTRAGAHLSKSEQTRALILETAMRLFQERGYDRT
ncbi:TetR/AcrR family transcriptional regulator, partial [Streptomyces tendae]